VKPKHLTAPLAFPQARIWFHEQLESNLPTYNVAYELRLRGALAPDALERALLALIERHEPLRTSFAASDEGPVQIVHEQVDWHMQHADLRDLAEPEPELARLRAGLALTPLPHDLAPLMRAQLVALDDELNVLLLTIHHMVFDGWSLGLFKRELAQLYTAYAQGVQATLEPLSIQYVDFAVWQRELVDTPLIAEQLEHWRSRLAGVPPLLALPASSTRPQVQSFVGERARFTIDEAQTLAIDRLAAAEGATPFMVALAAYAAFLARSSGQNDLVVGTPVANRLDAEIEGLIGCFINTLPLRMQVERASSFRELIAQAREVSLDAYANQDMPFERLVQETSERTLAHGAIFQTLLSFQNTPDEPLALCGLEGELEELDTGTSKFDVTLDLSRRGDVVEASWEYRSDLFTREDTEALVTSFRTMLHAALTDPDQPVGALPLLSNAERGALVEVGTHTPRAFPEQATVAGLFDEQARRTPDAVAVEDARRVLTYAQLRRDSNRLARHLSALGVGADSRVGICLEPGVDVLVALLAIHKAGAAYVPLDPDYPIERLDDIATDADLDALVSTSGLRTTIRAVERYVELDTEATAIAMLSGEDLAGHAAPDDLAYVIYTSGSTGRPKGVEISQRSLVNLLCGALDEFGLDAEDGLLAVTSLSFDISALEHFLPLLAGGKVVVAGRRPAEDPEALFGTLRRPDVTTMQTTPSFWQLMVDAGLPAGLIERALCGGEALSAGLAADLGDRVGALWNVYGPTETTIWSTCERIVQSASGQAPALGHPWANTDVHVVDERLEPVPVNVAGELVIGGAGLARGYRDQPALTAERFVPDPFSGRPGARLYRTGDLVRRSRDGRIEYLGRIDHQVKIRGVRIELAEIEAVLSEHPAVNACVATVWEPEPGDRRLVAYVLAKPAPALEELRALARSRLPRQALPSAYVVLDKLPTTPNGKVDRRALPSPVESESREVVPARDALELKLLELWKSALGRDDVGVTDSFLDLGGHSLSALQLAHRVRQETGSELDLATVLRTGTVEAAAEAIRGNARVGVARSLVHLNARAERRLFCVHSLVGTALRYRQLAQQLDGELELYAFQAPGVLGTEEPLSRIEALADRYLAELRDVAPAGPYALAGYSLGGLIAYEIAARLLAEGEQVEALFLLETFTPAADAAFGAMAPEVALARSLGANQDEDAITALPVQERLGRVWEEAMRRRALPPGVDLAELGRYLEVVRAHTAASEAYRPPSYAGDITLLRTEEWAVADETLGWGALVDGCVELVNAPGTHSTLLETPAVDVVARALRERLLR